MPEEVDRSEPGDVEEAPEPRRELAGADASEPWQLDEVEAMMLGEPFGEERPPAPGTGEPVHYDDVRPRPHDAVACGPPVELDLPLLHVGILHHQV